MTINYRRYEIIKTLGVEPLPSPPMEVEEPAPSTGDPEILPLRIYQTPNLTMISQAVVIAEANSQPVDLNDPMSHMTVRNEHPGVRLAWCSRGGANLIIC
ncbi:uncharacterized protein PV09_01630 [Verruconis gallopava]|uniref:Uncharacterized protein n=1 Tax=Verruconis gallopava TaxID=253628 RepID=A0A0D1XY04_9PEZI|nr:uncharacterized protein PV09_01630 [Verruconis gallopava]KIW07691.1 hypothetical protein PV09_01630 [Verruconis gallopava]